MKRAATLLIPFRVEPATVAVAVLVVEKPAEVEDLGTATEQLVPAEEPDINVPSEAEEHLPQ